MEGPPVNPAGQPWHKGVRLKSLEEEYKQLFSDYRGYDSVPVNFTRPKLIKEIERLRKERSVDVPDSASEKPPTTERAAYLKDGVGDAFDESLADAKRQRQERRDAKNAALNAGINASGTGAFVAGNDLNIGEGANVHVGDKKKKVKNVYNYYGPGYGPTGAPPPPPGGSGMPPGGTPPGNGYTPPPGGGTPPNPPPSGEPRVVSDLEKEAFESIKKAEEEYEEEKKRRAANEKSGKEAEQESRASIAQAEENYKAQQETKAAYDAHIAAGRRFQDEQTKWVDKNERDIRYTEDLEEVRNWLEKSRDDFAKTAAAREKHRRDYQRSGWGKVFEFFGAKGNAFRTRDAESRRLTDEYAAAESDYLKAQLAFSRKTFLSTAEGASDDEQRRKIHVVWVNWVLAERAEYNKAFEQRLAPEKESAFLKRLEGLGRAYAKWPTWAKISMGVTLATGVTAYVAPAAIAASGGAATWAGWRFLRATLGYTAGGAASRYVGREGTRTLEENKSTQITELVNYIKSRDDATLLDAIRESQQIADEYQRGQRKLGVKKVIAAVAAGGVTAGIGLAVDPTHWVGGAHAHTTGAALSVGHSGMFPHVKPPPGSLPDHAAGVAPHGGMGVPTTPAAHGPHTGAPQEWPADVPKGAAGLEPMNFGKLFMPKFHDVTVHHGDNLSSILNHELSKQSWFKSLPKGPQGYFVDSYEKWLKHLPTADRAKFGLTDINHIKPGQVLKLHLLADHSDKLREFMQNFAKLNPHQMHHLEEIIRHPSFANEGHHAAAAISHPYDPQDHVADTLDRREAALFPQGHTLQQAAGFGVPPRPSGLPRIEPHAPSGGMSPSHASEHPLGPTEPPPGFTTSGFNTPLPDGAPAQAAHSAAPIAANTPHPTAPPSDTLRPEELDQLGRRIN